MFDSISNIVIIFAIMAIFVGRTIFEVRKKKKAPPPKAAPRIPPLHFEIDEEEKTSQQIKTKGKTQKKQAAVPQKRIPDLFPEMTAASPSPAGARPSPARENVKTGMPAAGQGGFALNLNHLSPLKQAVVMAEILGPPKGLA